MNYKDLFETAEEMLPDFIRKHYNELGNRKGLYLITCNNMTNFSMHGILLGEIDNRQELIEKMELAQKKIKELITTGNRTTFPTQDYSTQKYGGGIYINCGVCNIYIAVSGFNPKFEHTFLREVLIRKNYLSGKTLKKVDAEFLWHQDKGVI